MARGAPHIATGETVTPRDLLAAQQQLQAQIDELRRKTLRANDIVFVWLTAAEVSGNFDSSGLAKPASIHNGRAICNGNNGTPDLRDRFIRCSGTGAGATGGSDSSAHTHAIDHDHGSFTSGTESSHTHGAEADIHGSLRALIHLDATNDVLNISADSGADSVWATDVDRQVAFSAGAVIDPNLPAGDQVISTFVQGETEAGSAHSHSVDVPSIAATSGAASATDNRPAFCTLVALMVLE